MSFPPSSSFLLLIFSAGKEESGGKGGNDIFSECPSFLLLLLLRRVHITRKRSLSWRCEAEIESLHLFGRRKKPLFGQKKKMGNIDKSGFTFVKLQMPPLLSSPCLLWRSYGAVCTDKQTSEIGTEERKEGS